MIRSTGRRRLLAGGLGVVAAAVVAVGCGGDDGGDAEPLTKEEFIAQADQICADASTDIDAKGEELFGSEDSIPSEEDITGFVEDEVIPSLREQADAIDELGAPEGDQDQVDAIVSALREGTDELEDDPASIISGEAESSFDEATRLAGEYGLEECGAN